MAEIEIGIFQRGCLSRRVDCMGTLRRRINALELERNCQTQSGLTTPVVHCLFERVFENQSGMFGVGNAWHGVRRGVQ